MRVRGLAPVLLAVAGCSDLSGPGGVVAIELRLPVPPVVEQYDTVRLRARALDLAGDSVAAAIYWRTPDTTLILTDSTGLLTTDTTSGAGRVQARVGSLYSELVTFTIRPRSDTLYLKVPDTMTVLAADTASGALSAAVESFAPTGGIVGTRILYEVVDTAAARDAVHFSNGALAIAAPTGTGGIAGPTLRRGTAPPPATVQVRVSAVRPSGAPVPGSPALFTLSFP